MNYKKIVLFVSLLFSMFLLTGCQKKEIKVEKIDYLSNNVNNYSIKFKFNDKIDKYNTKLIVYYLKDNRKYLIYNVSLMNICFDPKHERKIQECWLKKDYNGLNLKEGTYEINFYSISDKKMLLKENVKLELKGELELFKSYIRAYEPIKSNIAGLKRGTFFYYEIKNNITLLDYSEYKKCYSNCSREMYSKRPNDLGVYCGSLCKNKIKKVNKKGKFVFIHYGRWFEKKELKNAKKEILKICEINRNLSKSLLEEITKISVEYGFYCPISATTGVITTLSKESITTTIKTFSFFSNLFEGLFEGFFALLGFGSGYEYYLVTDFGNYYKPLNKILPANLSLPQNNGQIVFEIKEWEEPKYLVVNQVKMVFFITKRKTILVVKLN